MLLGIVWAGFGFVCIALYGLATWDVYHILDIGLMCALIALLLSFSSTACTPYHF